MTARLIAKQLRACFDRGNKCLIIGNGGSAAMASHFAAELIHERLPAIALTDIAVITALANDEGYEGVFATQVAALGKPNDILMVLSTSKKYQREGHSANLAWAISMAGAKGMGVIDFPKKGRNVQQIQEFQLKLLHQVWELLKQ